MSPAGSVTRSRAALWDLGAIVTWPTVWRPLPRHCGLHDWNGRGAGVYLGSGASTISLLAFGGAYGLVALSLVLFLARIEARHLGLLAAHGR